MPLLPVNRGTKFRVAIAAFFDVFDHLLVGDRLVVWPKSLGVEPIAPGKDGALLERKTLQHDFLVGTVEDFLAKPTPNAFPLFSGVDLKGIQNHGNACRAAIGWLTLSRELLGQREVVLHEPSLVSVLEDLHSEL